jgi:Spy/CpxP family protein refolding chaperone
MKKKWIITIGIIGILLIGSIGACRHGCRPGSFDEFDLAAVTNRIASRLDMTETQKVQFEQIAGEIMEKAKTMNAQRDAYRQELADLVRQDDIDKAVVDEMLEQKMVKMRELAEFAIARLITFHNTLTPEQREKIATRIEEHDSGRCRFGLR